MQRLWIGSGALAGLGAVIMAAVAAHALPGRLDPAAVAMTQSATQMLGWHALALLACGLWVGRGGRLADWAGAAFLAGLVLFCGSVYALALTGIRLGPLAPIGGSLLMLGWTLLAVSALRAR
jgi:uncharacterized membrane protein YgdD (TMEM256/DUF423 family)